MFNFRAATLFALSTLPFAPLSVAAQGYETPVTAEILPGWRDDSGVHRAAIRFRLKDGWKTYWRSPGDAGIPPRFTWSGSRNLRSLDVVWPTPDILDQGGMISLGYANEVVVPLVIDPKRAGKDIVLQGQLEIGVCKDICIPESIGISARLPGDATTAETTISVALNDRPYSAQEAGVSATTCDIKPSDAGMRITARIHMPSAGGNEFTVVETDNPMLWVAEATSQRKGGTLHVSTEVIHVEDQAFLLNRSGLRFTVLGSDHAVDIQGCSAG